MQAAPATRLCQELDAVGLQLLRTLCEPSSVLGTKCSDHLGQQAQWPDNVLPPSEATQLHAGLCSSVAAPWWTRMAGRELVLWSQAAPDEVGRLLGGFPALGERWAGSLARVEFALQPFEEIPPGDSPKFPGIPWAC